MAVILLLLATVALVSCQTPPRPNIPYNFESRVNVEQHAANEHLMGDGIYLSDFINQKSVENYRLHGTHHEVIPMFLYELQRFDLGQVYAIASQDFNECRMRVVQGRMPQPFAWVQQATYIGKDIFHHVELDLWALRVDGAVLEVGVQQPNYNVPFFYRNTQSNGAEFFMEFREFKGNTTIDSKAFDIPPPCRGQLAHAVPLAAKAAPAADPVRPNIPNSFDAQLAAEIFTNGHRLDGNIHWASDHTGSGRDVEIQDLHDDQRHEEFRTFTLNRYDQKMQYELDSWNRTTCTKKALTGTQPGPWDWVAQATFVGQRQERDGTVDVWQFLPGGGLNITLGVLDRSVNAPYFLARETPETRGRFFFQNFTPRIPDPNIFNVPQECN